MSTEYERAVLLAGEAVGLLHLELIKYSIEPDPDWRTWRVTVYRLEKKFVQNGIPVVRADPPIPIADVMFSLHDTADELADLIRQAIEDTDTND